MRPWRVRWSTPHPQATCRPTGASTILANARLYTLTSQLLCHDPKPSRKNGAAPIRQTLGEMPTYAYHPL